MRLFIWPMLLALAAPLAGADNAAQPLSAAPDPLYTTIATLDSTVFDAYNACDLNKFGAFFVPDVEFYHDHGGVTWTRQKVLDNTRKYICGKVRRELVEGTLEVYPIKGYGAVEIGEHRFCQTGTNQCEGLARFAMVWHQQGSAWRMTRVLSYDHHAAPVVTADAAGQPVAAAADPLFDTVASLDGELFGAYNDCDLKKFGSLVAKDVEFYHDRGGLMRSRQKLVDSVKKNICGSVHRQLVAGTLEVFPIKDFGAIETGDHRFCELATGRCDGLAKFIHIWRNDNGTWQLTRVISYDHHLAPQ